MIAAALEGAAVFFVGVGGLVGAGNCGTMGAMKRADDAPTQSLPHDETIAAVWPVAGDRRLNRRGKHPIFRALRIGFLGLAVVAFLALVAVFGLALYWPTLSGPAYLALININLVLGVLLALYAARRLLVMGLDRRGKLRGGRLHVRVLMIFGVLAVLPAVGVGGFAIYLLNQGIESWFSQRVSAALEGGRQVAEGYMEESGKGLQSDVLVLSRDTIWQISPMLLGEEMVGGWLRGQMREKQMDELALVDAEGLVMASGSGLNRGVLPTEAMAIVQQGAMGSDAASGVVWLNDGKRMLALAELKNGWWLAAERDLNPAMLARIGGTAEAYNAYAELQVNRVKLRWIVSLMVVFLLVATVALAVWAAFRLANKIVQPVTELVHGTNRVSAGDLSVRLQPRDDDELGVLTQAFNRMTFQLAANRELLERKNHELDERRRFMEAVLTSVSTGVVALDEANVVRVANQRAFALLKLEVGSKLAKVVPEVSEVVREALRQLAEQGVMGGAGHISGQKSLLQHEVKVTVAEGDVRTLMLRLVPQPLGGVVLTFDDMTPLIGAQRLAAWRDVARRLAHEIKNPLTPIQLSAERLKRRYLAKMPEEDKALFAQLTDTIVQQSEEMRRMTNEFSDFARMPQAVMQSENVIEVLDGVVALQRARGGVEIESDYGIAVAMVNMDKGQMQRVFTNILENAFNAVAEREGINLPQGRVRVVVSQQQPAILCIEIQDNGRGLPEDVAVEQLFDPYVTTRKGGTGLGLAIVKKVMDEHGGTVLLKRRREGGTTVALTLPLTEADVLGAAARVDKPAATPRATPRTAPTTGPKEAPTTETPDDEHQPLSAPPSLAASPSKRRGKKPNA